MSSNTATTRPATRKRALAVGLAAVVLTAGIAGASVSTTGAWFTATKTATGNSVTAGTVKLGDLGEGANGLVQAANAFPMTEAQATAADSAAAVATINIRNTGSLPVDWTAALSAPTITKAADNTSAANPDLSKVRVAYKLNNVWTATTLTAFIASPPAALVKPGTDLAAGASTSIALRVFFDAGALNEYQGATVGFTAKVDAQQVNQS